LDEALQIRKIRKYENAILWISVRYYINYKNKNAMKTKFITAMVVSLTVVFFSFMNANKNDARVSEDEQAVNRLVLGAYVNAAFNKRYAE